MTPAAVKPLAEWPAGNQRIYEGFCQWLRDGGYSDSAVYLYGRATRLALGWVDDGSEVVDFQAGSPDALAAHLARAKDAIAAGYGSQATCQTYFKGLAKLAEYVRYLRGEPPLEKQIDWDYYLDPLPKWLAGAVRTYLALQGRNWLPEECYRATCTLLSHLTLFLRWLAERVAFESAAEITPALWLDYVDGRLDAGIQASTLNRELRDLQHFLRFLADEDHPVCERMLRVELLDAGSSLPRDVPIDQLRRLQRQIEKEIVAVSGTTGRTALLDHAWFLLMLHCGLRSGEVRRLKLADLDLEARRVRIEQSKGLKDRIVCLSQETVAALSAYLAVRGPAAGDHVFVHHHRPLSRSYCGKRLHSLGAECSVCATPHQLRASFATLLLNACASVLTVQALLGHKHVDTTMRYARVYDSTVAADYAQATNDQVSSRLTCTESLPV